MICETDNPARTSTPFAVYSPIRKGVYCAKMTLSAQQKGKGRLLPQEPVKSARFTSSRSRSPSSASSSPSSSSSSSGSESDEGGSSEDEEEEVSQEYLDSLLEKARRSIASRATQNTTVNKEDVLEEDIIGLDGPESELKCVFLVLFFALVLILFKEPPSTGPGHFTSILYHARENA